jgi:hypothetical protein
MFSKVLIRRLVSGSVSVRERPDSFKVYLSDRVWQGIFTLVVLTPAKIKRKGFPLLPSDWPNSDEPRLIFLGVRHLRPWMFNFLLDAAIILYYSDRVYE